MEDFGAHGKDLSSAEEGGAGASGSLGPSSLGTCLLVSAAGQALAGRDLPAHLRSLPSLLHCKNDIKKNNVTKNGVMCYISLSGVLKPGFLFSGKLYMMMSDP